MATSLPWYKEVSPTQKKALFAAWLGYVFYGFGDNHICLSLTCFWIFKKNSP